MTTYQITALFLVEAPEHHSRAAEKIVHGLIQDLVGEDVDVDAGRIVIVGASAEGIREVDA